MNFQKLADEVTSMWNPIMQTIRQARQYLDDDLSEWTKDQQQEVENTVTDIGQMLEVVSDQCSVASRHCFCCRVLLICRTFCCYRLCLDMCELLA
jgi:hypothetical protein